jgi:hypothetical protein
MADYKKIVGNLTSVNKDQTEVLNSRATTVLPRKPEGPAIYYLFQNSETTGPFSAQAVVRLIDSGAIDYTTFCCTEGATEWKAVSDFGELSNV